jgi:hypothetical protein
MKAFLESISVILLVLVPGCGRHSNAPAPQITHPSLPLLRAFNEGGLGSLADEKTNHVYRFICKRTFDEPFSIFLRVRPDGAGALTCKMLSGKGGYEFGSIKEQREVVLSPGKVQSFLTLLDHDHFWKLEPGDTRMGFDGSYWFIEGVCTNHYQFVSRWSPEANTAVRRIGERLIEMADWKIERLY